MPKELEPVSQEAVEITDNLQKVCDTAFRTVLGELQIGMSEHDVYRALETELAKLGVTDFWYDIPIMVLSGVVRFNDMTSSDYKAKRPSEEVYIREGDPVFVDIHPREKTDEGNGRWGNYARTFIVNPTNQAQLSFARLMRRIELDGIHNLGALNRCQDVATYFSNKFQKLEIGLVDVRGNFGHNMGYGAKNQYLDRTFLDTDTHTLLEGQIWGIEPGGFTKVENDIGQHKILIARFEDCVHVSDGTVRTLGSNQPFEPTVHTTSKPYSKPL